MSPLDITEAADDTTREASRGFQVFVHGQTGPCASFSGLSVEISFCCQDLQQPTTGAGAGGTCSSPQLGMGLGMLSPMARGCARESSSLAPPIVPRAGSCGSFHCWSRLCPIPAHESEWLKNQCQVSFGGSVFNLPSGLH